MKPGELFESLSIFSICKKEDLMKLGVLFQTF